MIRSLKHAAKVASTRLLMAALASGALCAALLVAEQGVELARSFEPITDWFEPYELLVPTPQTAAAETPGEPANARPYLFYGRYIRRPFEAVYSVSVVRTDYSDVVACDHSDLHYYWPRGTTTLRVWTIDEFVGEHCHLDPGSYRIEVSWNLARDGYWPVRLHLDSNIFEITAK